MELENHHDLLHIQHLHFMLWPTRLHVVLEFHEGSRIRIMLQQCSIESAAALQREYTLGKPAVSPFRLTSVLGVWRLIWEVPL